MAFQFRQISETLLDQILGVLNFSSGREDPRFLRSLSDAYCETAGEKYDFAATWREVSRQLCSRLATLRTSSSAFSESDQAAAIVGGLIDEVIDAYLDFHRDLLQAVSRRELLAPFFIGKVAEAILAQSGPWGETDRITKGAVALLNDFVGYRPVPTLQSHRMEPDEHEFVRPIPIYVRGAGASWGLQHDVVEIAIKLLDETDDDILRAAHFDPECLDELSIDPRPYDFEHPANKRPNYHFGQWDPQQIDSRGRYRRMVMQHVTIDALMQRVKKPGKLPRDEVCFEAAAVLAGTILMASGISGWGPGAHDSTVNLGNLLPQIAWYRDAFYERLFNRVTGEHAKRLGDEAALRRQPFGGARQQLNSQLALKRATQLERVHIARIYAEMGFLEEAREQASHAPAAAARMNCTVHCLVSAGFHLLKNGELQEAFDQLPVALDVVRRAIACGAMIDPWCILGFDANFSLFPAMQNSIRDERADELVDIMERIFELYSQLWSEAAARDELILAEDIQASFTNAALWWRQFAAHEVESVDTVDSLAAVQASRRVADAMNLWHKGGAEAGNIRFWAPHAELFDAPNAYALVIEALLKRNDFVASRALLIHWLSEANRIPLDQGEVSWRRWAVAWMSRQRQVAIDEKKPEEAEQAWRRICKFLDYVEANADEYGQAPKFSLAPAAQKTRELEDQSIDEDDEDNVFRAAYEDVVFSDSAQDGFEGEVFDGGAISHDEIERELYRITGRLDFWDSLSKMWRSAATTALVRSRSGATTSEDADTVQSWIEHAHRHRRQLNGLLDSVREFALSSPSGNIESLIDYDRQRSIRDALLERIISACVEATGACRYLSAVARVLDRETTADGELPIDQRVAIRVIEAILRGEVAEVKRYWPSLENALERTPLLYVPLTKGGNPHSIVEARTCQETMRDFLSWLPRLGMFNETRQLLELARFMERENPVGAGAVTEFDELFKIGYRSMVRCIVISSRTWRTSRGATPEQRLVEALERTTESMLLVWLAHSRTLRLSVLERVKDRSSGERSNWEKLKVFIARYGGELFTQRFFNFANLRGILHHGVDSWLTEVETEGGDESEYRLFRELGSEISRTEAADQLELIIEAIIENYGEYRDYNSTTTQSDRGEMLYTLLDFLRLRMNYDRVAWNLRPVVWAHEVLVRENQSAAAEAWRRNLSEKMSDEADAYQSRLAALQREHAMKMPTIADRIQERFLHSMTIDRLRALVKPAIQENAPGVDRHHFEALQVEIESMANEPTGVGLDLPPWLASVEEEVERTLASGDAHSCIDDIVAPLKRMPSAKILKEVAKWKKS